VRKAIVGHETDAVGMLGPHQRQQRRQVARHRALAHHQEDAGRELLATLVEGGALVVRVDAARQVGLQRAAAERRRVAIGGLAGCLGQRHLVELGSVSRHHRREAHHLGHAHHPGMCQQPLDIGQPQVRARGLEGGGRDRARHHHPHVQRQRLAALEEPLHAGRPGHVGDLVGVPDDPGHAARHHALGVGARGDQRRLDVHVAVDQPRGQRGAAKFDDGVGVWNVVIAGHGRDEPARNGHGCGRQAAVEDVHHAAISQQQTGRPAARRHVDRAPHLIGRHPVRCAQLEIHDHRPERPPALAGPPP